MNHKSILGLSLFAVFALFVADASPARADLDLEVAGLIGTGVDTGGADNNPYALQLGALGELIINNYVIGVRGTRSLASDADDCTVRCRNVKGVRSFGADLGYEWDLSILHLGPRLGIGYLNENDGRRAGGYLEPGGVAELNILLFAVGIDLRYRVAIAERDLNGFLAYLRLGLRI